MIRLQQLKLSVNHTELDLEKLIAKTLRLSQGQFQWQIVRRSLDARKKPDLFYVYTIDVHAAGEKAVVKKLRSRQVTLISEKKYHFPFLESVCQDSTRPVIVGSGPAGLFCALMLARSGLKPIILERGECVEKRTEDVTGFWETGKLNAVSNVQFGEGGAGTFSDGKLNTAIKDPESRIRFVLETFVEAGADPGILYDYKPHVGTDVLVNVVRHIRQEIEALGGSCLFRHQLTGIHKTNRDGEYRLTVNADGQEKIFFSDRVVLAIGHSARDTFQMLQETGFHMTPKAFAMGVRVIHTQELIDRSQYGSGTDAASMPPAPYKLTHRLADGRGVYSFCMCPGGYVVNASSEEGRLAVNGMSYHDRASEYANSAIVVTVPVSDFPDHSPLAGVAMQRDLEERAFRAGNGKIPVQTFADFRTDRSRDTAAGTSADFLSARIPVSDAQKNHINPADALRGLYTFADVRGILPPSLGEALQEGILAFGKQIQGFDRDDTLLCGVESRTSSPVRIERSAALTAEHFPGIYPCGEGAGYAGGITSAAVDGIRVAEAIAASLR